MMFRVSIAMCGCRKLLYRFHQTWSWQDDIADVLEGNTDYERTGDAVEDATQLCVFSPPWSRHEVQGNDGWIPLEVALELGRKHEGMKQLETFISRNSLVVR